MWLVGDCEDGVLTAGKGPWLDRGVLLAIDPGDVHVGWCLWEGGEWETGTCSPEDMIQSLLETDFEWRTVVIERFALYPWAAQQQAWSEMMTAQLIGKIELVAEIRGWPVERQNATIKKAAMARARGAGISPNRMGSTLHAQDAWCHAAFWIWKEK